MLTNGQFFLSLFLMTNYSYILATTIIVMGGEIKRSEAPKRSPQVYREKLSNTAHNVYILWCKGEHDACTRGPIAMSMINVYVYF